MARPTGKGTVRNETVKEVVKDMVSGSAEKKKNKYRVNIVFDGDLEDEIREAAAQNGMKVATFIKWSVMKQINNNKY